MFWVKCFITSGIGFCFHAYVGHYYSVMFLKITIYFKFTKVLRCLYFDELLKIIKMTYCFYTKNG